MAKSSSNKHAITVCTDCRITGTPCRPGLELLARLNESLARLGRPLDRDFSVSGTVCMAGCTRPCTIAFQASGKATYLFGDILPDQDIDDLMAFAGLYAGRGDGLTRAAERPWGLNGKTIARIPAALVASELLGERLQ
ncbi:DUF1636 family protein [Pararhizobium antarcticum]|uniref:Metal-binding protein n=1 Tax=Pararhizobium antarcticum TaxID=1798805 RepID=A0A657LVU5_9HYPH|nr:DUF1636 domain-containing protein [Pararhizobium antarcticum]OJF91961.1 hypothetical protein AX761_05595 [Rhizobium sp. 58]OJF98344.1 hypothetical protein AX760_14655 [Pararhizobium antarcticum]